MQYAAQGSALLANNATIGSAVPLQTGSKYHEMAPLVPEVAHYHA